MVRSTNNSSQLKEPGQGRKDITVPPPVTPEASAKGGAAANVQLQACYITVIYPCSFSHYFDFEYMHIEFYSRM